MHAQKGVSLHLGSQDESLLFAEAINIPGVYFMLEIKWRFALIMCSLNLISNMHYNADLLQSVNLLLLDNLLEEFSKCSHTLPSCWMTSDLCYSCSMDELQMPYIILIQPAEKQFKHKHLHCHWYLHSEFSFTLTHICLIELGHHCAIKMACCHCDGKPWYTSIHEKRSH